MYFYVIYPIVINYILSVKNKLLFLECSASVEWFFLTSLINAYLMNNLQVIFWSEFILKFFLDSLWKLSTVRNFTQTSAITRKQSFSNIMYVAEKSNIRKWWIQKIYPVGTVRKFRATECSSVSVVCNTCERTPNDWSSCWRYLASRRQTVFFPGKKAVEQGKWRQQR